MYLTRNNILPTYLGNYGLSYVGNDNIPNPWTIIPNPYYPRNLPLTFPNTSRHVAYPFPNVVSTRIVVTRESKGVQMIVPISGFYTGNLVPYFQPPTWNPPLGFCNSRGGMPTKGDGNPFHGSGGPLGGGSGPSKEVEEDFQLEAQVCLSVLLGQVPLGTHGTHYGIIMAKHGKYDYTHDYVCSCIYHSWLHDYVVHMDMLFIH
jgi:hypothetical protein